MSLTRIAVDAMGGDNAPQAIVDGTIQALKESRHMEVYLVGQADRIEQALSKYSETERERVTIIEASEVIEMAEPPVAAIRKKKDSSIVVALNLVKNGEADAFVSAGSTGAILVGGQLIIGKLPGVKRAPLAPLIPTKKGVSLLIDCGANVDARSEHLVSFAKMGSIYMKYVLGKKDPTVGIVNIGAEEEKGNALVKETFPLLKACEDIHFTGSVEARDIPKGDVDVIVTEAFVGNVILKMYEGVSKTLLSVLKKSLLSSVLSKVGAAMVLPALKKNLKTFDASEYGGAPLLGLKGLVVKAHGSSKAKEIKNSLLQCVTFHEEDINGKILEKLSKKNKEEA
ncbi:MAG: phosphate acyltransferase PlsX [Lachnospiraceae bacterium]|nr:phosphate acyltransferase PlsX [Lachnospiraceae bacterium]MBQ2576744.1 phosphate acyltransferase PlsX [Lachnospiraceae bacterium]MBQ5485117.1 phosphate acyltransferase PlsX [Lachnospiraceae bacterium]MEE3355205.1 phosphate acyltransferase PlsX [Candidatus Weimeria sp.]